MNWKTAGILLGLFLLPSLAIGSITKGPYLQNMTRDGVTICFDLPKGRTVLTA